MDFSMFNQLLQMAQLFIGGTKAMVELNKSQEYVNFVEEFRKEFLDVAYGMYGHVVAMRGKTTYNDMYKYIDHLIEDIGIIKTTKYLRLLDKFHFIDFVVNKSNMAVFTNKDFSIYVNQNTKNSLSEKDLKYVNRMINSGYCDPYLLDL